MGARFSRRQAIAGHASRQAFTAPFTPASPRRPLRAGRLETVPPQNGRRDRGDEEVGRAAKRFTGSFRALQNKRAGFVLQGEFGGPRKYGAPRSARQTVAAHAPNRVISFVPYYDNIMNYISPASQDSAPTGRRPVATGGARPAVSGRNVTRGRDAFVRVPPRMGRRKWRRERWISNARLTPQWVSPLV